MRTIDGAIWHRPHPFRVRLTISAPPTFPLNLGNYDISEPLVDVFLSAAHFQQNPPNAVIQILANHLQLNNAQVIQLLQNSQNAVLGAWATPKLGIHGLVWTPADRYLVICEIIRETSRDDRVAIGGEIMN